MQEKKKLFEVKGALEFFQSHIILGEASRGPGNEAKLENGESESHWQYSSPESEAVRMRINSPELGGNESGITGI